jgi:ACS family tartrate transporter-like MFS transporter
MTADPLEGVTLRRVSRRLIPFLFVVFIANYLDRVNVSFAALQMNRDLGLSGAAYGLGAGIFFLGYVPFQVPSSLLLARVGARRWIGALTMAWGCIAAAMMLVRGPASFYLLRFLLGVVEAGFFPGVIYYFTAWFPAAERARAVARFMTAIPIAQIVGGPLSGWLLDLHGRAGLAGWQWLFLLEGLPSIALGALVLVYLTDRPEGARWLPSESRDWLIARLRAERPPEPAAPRRSLARVLAMPLVWRLSVVWFLMVLVGYGQLLWLPQLIKGASGLSNLAVGVLSTVPPLAAAVAMVRIAAHSDRTGERRRHVALPSFLTALGFAAAAALLHAPLLATAALTLVAIGIAGSFGPFWGLATWALGGAGAAAAGGIALVNALGNVGGFAGPTVVGVVKDATGSFAGALLAFAGLAALAGSLALGLRSAR